MIGTAVLACLGMRSKGMATGTFCDGLGAPTTSGTVPPPPPMSVVPVYVEEEMDLIKLAILSVVTLVSWSHLYLLIRLT